VPRLVGCSKFKNVQSAYRTADNLSATVIQWPSSVTRDLCDQLLYPILRHGCGYISTVTRIETAHTHTHARARTQDDVTEIVWRVVSEISGQDI